MPETSPVFVQFSPIDLDVGESVRLLYLMRIGSGAVGGKMSMILQSHKRIRT